jgi:hypothetical protein
MEPRRQGDDVLLAGTIDDGYPQPEVGTETCMRYPCTFVCSYTIHLRPVYKTPFVASVCSGVRWNNIQLLRTAST